MYKQSEHELNRLRVILDEVTRETEKSPDWSNDPLHALAILGEEYGELTKEVLKMTYEQNTSSVWAVRHEAIQTAAKAIRFVLSLEEYRYEPSSQHSQKFKTPHLR